MDQSPVSVPQGAKASKVWAGVSTVPRGPHLLWLEAHEALGVIFNTNTPVRGDVGQ